MDTSTKRNHTIQYTFLKYLFQQLLPSQSAKSPLLQGTPWYQAFSLLKNSCIFSHNLNKARLCLTNPVAFLTSARWELTTETKQGSISHTTEFPVPLMVFQEDRIHTFAFSSLSIHDKDTDILNKEISHSQAPSVHYFWSIAWHFYFRETYTSPVTYYAIMTFSMLGNKRILTWLCERPIKNEVVVILVLSDWSNTWWFIRLSCQI